MKTRLLASAALLLAAQGHAAAQDPYLWLENIQGKDALQWVHQQNALTVKETEGWKSFPQLKRDILAVLDSSARIPSIEKIGDRYYNFWRDAQHPRGLWRSATLDEYRKADPAWEMVLDLDKLAKEEKENWVWQGADCVKPKQDRCLIRLSRGGGDAAVVREFDLPAKRFLADGFVVPEAKSEVNWADRDTLYVATDFGKGSLTDSGYPRIVKEWKRGQPLAAAATLFEGKQTDISVNADGIDTAGHHYDVISQGTTSKRPSMAPGCCCGRVRTGMSAAMNGRPAACWPSRQATTCRASATSPPCSSPAPPPRWAAAPAPATR